MRVYDEAVWCPVPTVPFCATRCLYCPDWGSVMLTGALQDAARRYAARFGFHNCLQNSTILPNLKKWVEKGWRSFQRAHAGHAQ